MPDIATQLYQKNPRLQLMADLLGRCAADGRSMVASFDDAQARNAARIAWPALSAARCEAGSQGQPCLRIERAAWLQAAAEVLPLLARELAIRIPLIRPAMALAPVAWNDLELSDAALKEWGANAGMVALPAKPVSSYLGARYANDALQRRPYVQVTNAARAADLNGHAVFGLVVDADGSQYVVCSGACWRDEAESARLLLDQHVFLVAKIGLQMLQAGATGHLKDLAAVLGLMPDSVALVRLQTLIEACDACLPGIDSDHGVFAGKLVGQCLSRYMQWQRERKLTADGGLCAAYCAGLEFTAAGPTPMPPGQPEAPKKPKLYCEETLGNISSVIEGAERQAASGGPVQPASIAAIVSAALDAPAPVSTSTAAVTPVKRRLAGEPPIDVKRPRKNPPPCAPKSVQGIFSDVARPLETAPAPRAGAVSPAGTAGTGAAVRAFGKFSLAAIVAPAPDAPDQQTMPGMMAGAGSRLRPPAPPQPAAGMDARHRSRQESLPAAEVFRPGAMPVLRKPGL